MIVTDTTAVSTSRKNGAVIILQCQQKLLNLPVTQYVGCKHILDLILKRVMDETLGGAARSPDIANNFVDDIVREYDFLKTKFVQRPTRLNLPTITWRGDMLFVLELGYTFSYFFDNGEFPYIKFRGLPNLSNPRWNSSGTYAILAFILFKREIHCSRFVYLFVEFSKTFGFQITIFKKIPILSWQKVFKNMKMLKSVLVPTGVKYPR